METLTKERQRKMIPDLCWCCEDEKPKFEHDCDACVFLGRFSKYDLYFCNSQNPTVIARFGDYGDYYSGLVFAATNPALATAVSRAYHLGLWYTPAPTPREIMAARKRAGAMSMLQAYAQYKVS